MPLDPGTAILTILAFVGGQIVIAGIQEYRAGREAHRQGHVRAEQRAADDARAAADRRRALGEREIDEARRALLPALEYYAMCAAGGTNTDQLEATRLTIPRTSELIRWDLDTVGDAELVIDVLEATDKYAGMTPTSDRAEAEAIIREHATLRRRVVQALREQERRLADGVPLESKPATVRDLERVTTMMARPLRLRRDEGVPPLAAPDSTAE
jgi:hypothetical protein